VVVAPVRILARPNAVRDLSHTASYADTQSISPRPRHPALRRPRPGAWLRLRLRVPLLHTPIACAACPPATDLSLMTRVPHPAPDARENRTVFGITPPRGCTPTAHALAGAVASRPWCASGGPAAAARENRPWCAMRRGCHSLGRTCRPSIAPQRGGGAPCGGRVTGSDEPTGWHEKHAHPEDGTIYVYGGVTIGTFVLALLIGISTFGSTRRSPLR
jgi:hypothetical protein